MEDLVGRSLGQYEILEEIGRGGMAFVYRAMQTSVGREVAIKVMPQHFLQDAAFLERFTREVHIIAQLQHPRILPIYDHGEQDGIPYIVMAYIRGGTLADRIRESKGGLPFDGISRLLGQIAEGLDFAHRQGIVHRDLKPSNVLLDREDNVHLADFGIARISEATAQLTGSGIMGSPAYMAPEMADRGGTSPLVDVYALGVTVYQMVTGQLPFDADTPLGLLMAHASRPIPDAREYRADVSDSVQAVIERAMAKDPMRRYQSASELAGDFQAALTGAPISPPTVQARAPGTRPIDASTEAVDIFAVPPVHATPPEVPPPVGYDTAEGRIHATPPMPAIQPEPVEPEEKHRRRWVPILGVVGGLLGAAAACVVAAMVFGSIPLNLGGGGATNTPDHEPVEEEVAPPTATPTKTPAPATPTYTSEPSTPTYTVEPPTPTTTSTYTPTVRYVPPTATSTATTTPEQSGGGGGGGCGSVCGENADCAGGLTCFQGICWDDCICEGRGCGCPPDCGGDSGGGGGNATVNLVANVNVCYVRISPTSSGVWGPDWLGPTEIVYAGNTRMFSVTPGDYDLKAEDCSHNALSVQWGVSLGAGSTYTWTVP